MYIASDLYNNIFMHIYNLLIYTVHVWTLIAIDLWQLQSFSSRKDTSQN